MHQNHFSFRQILVIYHTSGRVRSLEGAASAEHVVTLVAIAHGVAHHAEREREIGLEDAVLIAERPRMATSHRALGEEKESRALERSELEW